MLINKEKYPKEKIVSKMKESAQGLQFPINRFDDLVRQKNEIQIDDKKVKVSDLKQLISDNYYPIRDAQDLNDKVGKLYDELPGTEKEKTRGKEIPKDDTVPNPHKNLERIKEKLGRPDNGGGGKGKLEDA